MEKRKGTSKIMRRIIEKISKMVSNYENAYKDVILLK